MSKRAWMPVRLDIGEDPRVRRAARSLSISRYQVVGMCIALWGWAQQHTVDGSLPHTTDQDIDDLVDHDGFAKALRLIGWLENHPTIDGGTLLPRWEQHNSNGAKARLQTAERVSRKRERECNAESVTESLQERDLHNRTEEREEEKTDAAGAASGEHRASHAASPGRVAWSVEGGFVGVTDRDRETWAAAFPAVNLERATAEAHAWLTANPTRAKKRNYRRFLMGWFSRQQERGGDAASAARAVPRGTHAGGGVEARAGPSPMQRTAERVAEERRRRREGAPERAVDNGADAQVAG